MSGPDGLEEGRARARVLRLAFELARGRHTSRDRVLAALASTNLWREMGSPEVAHMTVEQAQDAATLLGRWLAKAREGTAPPRRATSQAPPAPWQARGSGESDGREGKEGDHGNETSR